VAAETVYVVCEYPHEPADEVHRIVLVTLDKEQADALADGVRYFVDERTLGEATIPPPPEPYVRGTSAWGDMLMDLPRRGNLDSSIFLAEITKP
jgi:hypothetical protein